MTLLLLLGAPGAGASQAPSCSHPGGAPARTSLHYMRSTMLCLVNRVRASSGLPPLRYSADLRRAASAHSNEMVAQHFFSHEGANGSSMSARVARTGYLARAGSWMLGENIGGGNGRRYGSPWAVYRAWMNSPPHRANILSHSFREFGVGVARGFPLCRCGRNSATYTLDFARR